MPFANSKGPGNSLQPGPRLIDGSDILAILNGQTSFSNLSMNAGFFAESSTDNITAKAGGAQLGATLLFTEINRITTVASVGDSVMLPGSQAGFTLMVINSGANAMTVFGNNLNGLSDTIDGVANATGVTQMPGSMVFYTCSTIGSWFTEGLATGYSGSFQTLSYTPTITAYASGGQTSAVQLTSMVNRVSTATAQGASVKLPVSAPGMEIVVINKGAFPIQVFGSGTDTINGIATATGIAQGINTTATYICNVAGNWEVPIGTLQSSTPQALSGSADAIPPHVGHTYVVTTAGVDAMTLAAPTATTDDGIEITVTSNTANAHTITTSGLLQTGTASVNVATFAAQKGAGVTLMAYQGKWNVLASVGITFS